jgi:hypothetical protein
MTINAEYIQERCDGTTVEEVSTRSKTLGHGLRRLRTMERDVRQGRISAEQLRTAWDKLINTALAQPRKQFSLKPTVASIEEEMGYVDVELQLPWHKYGAFGFHHHCIIDFDGEEVDMGTYHVDLITQECGSAPGVWVQPLKDCFCGYTGTLHPHVSDGQLCLGDGRQHLWNAWSSKNIQAVIDIITSTLNNYNPGSPYQSFDKWLEADQYCSHCHRRMDYGDSREVNPHGMPRNLRGVWDTCLGDSYRTEHHPLYGKELHDIRGGRSAMRKHNWPEGTFRNVTICSRCFNEMRDATFRQALRSAVTNHEFEIRQRRRRRDNPRVPNTH